MAFRLDTAAAVSFLRRFNFVNVTVAVLPERKKKSLPLEGKLLYSDKENTSKLSACVPISDLDTLLPELTDAQKRGWGVFFMVSDGDGVPTSPTNPNCRSERNVTALNCCFMDMDNPSPTFDPQTITPQPHLVVQSSPGKYHCYWLISPVLKDRHVTKTWQAIQQALALKYGADCLTDTCRVLRVPGYYHLKGDPTLVKLLTDNDLPLYELETLATLTNAHDLPDSPNPNALPKLDLQSDTVIPQGERHKRILSEATKRFSRGDTYEETLCYIQGFISRHIANPEDYAPTGKEHDDLLRILTHAENFILSQETELTLQALDAPPMADPLELPGEFYLSAPGLVGDITREICKHALYPVPALTFALAAATVGLLKARSVLSPYKNPPTGYYLCLAPSGVGKNFPQEVLSRALQDLSLSPLLAQGLRSDKGIMAHLEFNDSLGLIVLDEAKSFFSSLQDRSTPAYYKSIRYLLAELYTSSRKTFNSGRTGNRKDTPFTLKNPKLSLVAFAQPSLLQTALSQTMILEGLLPRFLLFVANTRSPKNANFAPGYRLPGPVLDQLRTLATMSALAAEETLTPLTDPTATTTPPGPLTDPSVTTLSYSPEALQHMQGFQDHLDSLYHEEVRKQSSLEALYSRGFEMADRLCTALSDPTEKVVNISIARFSCSLVQHQLMAASVQLAENLDSSQESLKADRLLAVINTQYSSSKGPVHRREVQMCSRFLSGREFKDCYQYLLETKQVKEVKVREPSGQVAVKILPCVSIY